MAGPCLDKRSEHLERQIANLDGAELGMDKHAERV